MDSRTRPSWRVPNETGGNDRKGAGMKKEMKGCYKEKYEAQNKQSKKRTFVN